VPALGLRDGDTEDGDTDDDDAASTGRTAAREAPSTATLSGDAGGNP